MELQSYSPLNEANARNNAVMLVGLMTARTGGSLRHVNSALQPIGWSNPLEVRRRTAPAMQPVVSQRFPDIVRSKFLGTYGNSQACK